MTGRKALCYLVISMTAYSMSAAAQTSYNGTLARDIDVSYGVGGQNSVTGSMLNKSDRSVDVTVSFKGYASDGSVIQGDPSATIAHLSPGESARFRAAGFSEMATTAKLIEVRTVP